MTKSGPTLLEESMPVHWDVARGPAVLLLLLALASLVTACEVSVVEPQATSQATQQVALSTGVRALAAYDVAVSAVDFDPPLRREALVSSTERVTLLAAVENRGSMPLTKITVEARLTSPKGEFTAQDRAEIARLSPGEVHVVEFAGMQPYRSLPSASSYKISVRADAQQADSQTANNVREVIVTARN